MGCPPRQWNARLANLVADIRPEKRKYKLRCRPRITSSTTIERMLRKIMWFMLGLIKDISMGCQPLYVDFDSTTQYY